MKVRAPPPTTLQPPTSSQSFQWSSLHMRVCAVNAMQRLMCYSQPGSGGWWGCPDLWACHHLRHTQRRLTFAHRGKKKKISKLILHGCEKKRSRWMRSRWTRSRWTQTSASSRREESEAGGINQGACILHEGGEGAPGTIGCRRGYGGRRR